MKSEIRVKEYDIKSYERNLKKLEDESSLNVFIGSLILYGLFMYSYIQRDLNSNSKLVPLFSLLFYRLFLI